MKTFFLFILAQMFFPLAALAHEGETEFTNLAEAEWVGPLIAVLIITIAIIVARIMRGKSIGQVGMPDGREVNNNNTKEI